MGTPAAEYLILAAVSAAAGVALGRVIPRRLRRFIFAGGVAAALLGAAVTWVLSRGTVGEALTVDFVGAALFGAAVVFLPFAFGASLTGP